MHKSNIYRAMQRIFKTQNIRFRSIKQELAIYAMLDKQTPLVIVLLIGRGKSLLFIVLEYIEKDRITIVIVLYYILITNLVTRICRSSIKCIE
jgi:superfamily II DNA helicase RecQ